MEKRTKSEGILKEKNREMISVIGYMLYKSAFSQNLMIPKIPLDVTSEI